MSHDKTIIISGGSRGLGLAFSRFCLQKGSRVASFARRKTDGVRELEGKYPEQYLFRSLDAAQSNLIEEFVEGTLGQFGMVDCLVNNAASGQDHLLSHLPDESITSILDVNLKAAIFLTKYVLRHMLLTSGERRIVNISSICGSKGYPGLSVYAATKGALNALTRSLAHEYGNRGIKVNAIAPGFFESEMSSLLNDRQIESIRRRTPLGRLITVEDILPVFEHLVYEDTALTGQILTVDGGITS